MKNNRKDGQASKEKVRKDRQKDKKREWQEETDRQTNKKTSTDGHVKKDNRQTDIQRK